MRHDLSVHINHWKHRRCIAIWITFFSRFLLLRLHHKASVSVRQPTKKKLLHWMLHISSVDGCRHFIFEHQPKDSHFTAFYCLLFFQTCHSPDRLMQRFFIRCVHKLEMSKKGAPVSLKRLKHWFGFLNWMQKWISGQISLFHQCGDTISNAMYLKSEPNTCSPCFESWISKQNQIFWNVNEQMLLLAVYIQQKVSYTWI